MVFNVIQQKIFPLDRENSLFKGPKLKKLKEIFLMDSIGK